MGNMSNKASLFPAIIMTILLSLSLSGTVVCNIDPCREVPATDNDILEFLLNLYHLEAELFLRAATGNGTDDYDPSLAAGGPPPIGSRRATLGPLVRRVVEEFGYQKLGQLREIIREIVGRVPPRPLLNLSTEVVADFADAAIGRRLIPRFDPYANDNNFILTAQSITYTSTVSLVGATTTLISRGVRLLVAKLLAMEAGQNTFFRSYLYQRANQIVIPYNITIAEFTNRTSELTNRLAKCGLKDEGILVPRSLGAENRTDSNLLAADFNSLAYTRITKEVLRIFYGTGNESRPGSYFPNGANGDIARRYIQRNG
ncbi:desiccation-related protein PCC13-62-like [Benincasa hispida]|uniref:desiccation-related protein PCC13-62-like n=1 Tax=Benincasa hispida TaxID=102211 RepID=UPI001900B416|nr:desiccation-related protein PCC13-62-like [Benincasa hispida]